MEDIIRGTLPHIDDETLGRLVESLSAMGLREADDMMYIREDDIKDLLSIVDCRKLLHKFSNRGKASFIAKGSLLRNPVGLLSGHVAGIPLVPTKEDKGMNQMYSLLKK
jgi:hypothetical protein